MLSAFLVLVSFLGVVSGLHLKHRGISIDVTDTSNCTWSEWSDCRLESQSRCARVRTLELLPLANQTLSLPNKVPCYGRAGSEDSVDCDNGFCPVWSIGNWTDCSSTCGSQLPPWEGHQIRDVSCKDSAGILYSAEVCSSVRGIASVPINDQPCPCSHTAPRIDPYAVTYAPSV